MGCTARFAVVLAGLALIPVLATAHADESSIAAHAQGEHGCLSQRERRVEAESGKLVRLAVAIHAAKVRAPGAVVRARLCRGTEGLVYVLTVLAHDGKVARITVDAVKGTLVGGL
jgi:uncharacterized membrane protein YkoI